MAFQGVSQMKSCFEPVMILPPDAFALEIARPFEVDHDSLHSPFGNLHFQSNISNADIGFGGDATEDVGVVTQERPIGGRRLIACVSHYC